MSVIQKIIHQAFFTGRVGNHVLYDRLGTPCVKNLTDEFHPERNLGRMSEISQARFAFLVSLYQAMGGTRARMTWRVAPRKRGRTGYNSFVSRNYGAFGEGEAVADYAVLQLCDGVLRQPRFPRVTVTGERELTFAWETGDDQLLGARGDRPRVLLMPDDGSYCVIAREALAATRADGEVTVTLLPDEGQPAHAYLYWESADGRRFSPSLYLPVSWPGGEGA